MGLSFSFFFFPSPALCGKNCCSIDKKLFTFSLPCLSNIVVILSPKIQLFGQGAVLNPTLHCMPDSTLYARWHRGPTFWGCDSHSLLPQPDSSGSCTHPALDCMEESKLSQSWLSAFEFKKITCWVSSLGKISPDIDSVPVRPHSFSI